MAVEPLSRLSLRATSLADDLGFVALADLASVLAPGDEAPYRIIGGQMVMALAARWGLGSGLYRATLDADLGTPPMVVRDHTLVDRLVALGYRKVAGDRFTRIVDDLPVGDGTQAREAVIDILLPAYTSRPSDSKRVGPLIAIEVLGLAAALRRPPVVMDLELQRLNGEVTDVALCFPDEPSALVLKAFATRSRHKATDHTDVWRCLEIALAASVTPTAFTDGEMSEGADLVRSLFSDRHGPGMSGIIEDQRLSDTAADQRFTRIRALISAIVDA